MRDRVDLAIVGAGASGLSAAASAARRGASVAVLERLPRIGRKLLATGGGRCNLLNDGLAPYAFTSTAPNLVSSVLERFGGADIRSFFEGLGLRLQADDAGRVYPVTNQAGSVLKVLELEMSRRGVTILTGFDVERIDPAAGHFLIGAADRRKVEAAAVVLAGGGRSYPALGSDGSCHRLAAVFGHSIVKPVPSAVPLLVKTPICHFLQGQRMQVRIESRVGGRRLQEAEGEILFTQYGFSGPAALDVSERLSIALNRDGRKDASVAIDFLPFMTVEQVTEEFSRRTAAGWDSKNLSSGLLPEKFSLVMPHDLRDAGPAPGKSAASATARSLAASLKAWEFPVHGTRGWNEAEFTSGGVDAREVKPGTLESRLRRGLYLAGEVLDVQAGRGGFNLAWAWASGYVAGLAE